MFEKIVSKANELKGLLTDLPQGKELPSMGGIFNDASDEPKDKKKNKEKGKEDKESDCSSGKGTDECVVHEQTDSVGGFKEEITARVREVRDMAVNAFNATCVDPKQAIAMMKIFGERDPDVNPAVTESPNATTDTVSQPTPEPEVSNDPALLSGSDTYDEILDALAKNGYFIDNVDGELDKVSKDLYGFKHNDLVVVLTPKAAAIGDDYILLQSITLTRQVIDGVVKLEPTYGASFGVACGTPVVTELNEDVVSLHNKLLQTVGYTGQGSLVVRQSPDGGLVTMAGHLVSLTQPQ